MKLGDIATYINGYAFKPIDWQSEGMPIIRIQNLNNPNQEFNYFNGAIDEKYVVRRGDILISWSASIGVFEWDREDAVLNQHIFKVKFDKIEVNKTYFKFVVSKALERAMQYMHGSTMKHITKGYFDAIPISLPDLKTQQKIADALTKANELIDKRKEQIEACDELIKSQFIEMFGDPVSNNKKWEVKQLQEIGTWKSGGTPSRSNNDYFKGDIDWYSAGELNQLYLEESVEKITQQAIEESSAKLFNKGSMLVGMYDTAAFKMGILQKDSASNQACANVMPNSSVNIVWLYYNLMHMKEHFLSNRRGIRQKNLNLGMIKEFLIPVPSIELQNEFVQFVQQVDKLKVEMQQSLVELENNFNSLMQKAFKGKLFSN